jgi:hypothetical protein
MRMDTTSTAGPVRRKGHRARPMLALALVALAAAGCSSSGSDAQTGSAAGGRADEFSAAAPRAAGLQAADRAGAGGGSVQTRAVISTGEVELTSTDVASARTDVDAVQASLGGQVADENTVTNDHGTVTRAHLVVRVPSARFDDAMKQLEGVANLRSSSRKAADVTTQVIDVQARIAAQRAGVRRLRQLVARTGDLRALLAVERELSARQGELESLLRQRAYLADQTSLATITVDITRHVPAATPAQATAGGFVGGLRDGWHALVAVGTGVMLTVGLVLPFALVAALVGVPAWLVVRRVRRGHEEPEAPAEA